ncbi:hypothetical protein KKF84_09895 [Myxococcota bacterium]|nr:hypothetical protein [Myxococcota bacterium]MBU1535622.1 hypothetical protein [Myxococcota bacterium]
MKIILITALFLSMVACSKQQEKTSPKTTGTTDTRDRTGLQIKDENDNDKKPDDVKPKVNSGHKHDGQGSEDLQPKTTPR